MNYTPINPSRLKGRIKELWSPRIIAEMNDYHFKLARVSGEFVWHSHDDTDEAFIVLDGALTIEMRDGMVHLEEGEIFVVPRGIEHRPIAKRECFLLLIEPAGTVNTGNASGDLTAPEEWIEI